MIWKYLLLVCSILASGICVASGIYLMIGEYGVNTKVGIICITAGILNICRIIFQSGYQKGHHPIAILLGLVVATFNSFVVTAILPEAQQTLIFPFILLLLMVVGLGNIIPTPLLVFKIKLSKILLSYLTWAIMYILFSFIFAYFYASPNSVFINFFIDKNADFQKLFDKAGYIAIFFLLLSIALVYLNSKEGHCVMLRDENTIFILKP